MGDIFSQIDKHMNNDNLVSVTKISLQSKEKNFDKRPTDVQPDRKIFYRASARPTDTHTDNLTK